MSQEYDKMMRQFADKYRHVCVANNSIDAKLFEQYGVKRGLRDKNGKGVLSGITNISLIKATEETEDDFVRTSDMDLRRSHFCCYLENFLISRSCRNFSRYW